MCVYYVVFVVLFLDMFCAVNVDGLPHGTWAAGGSAKQSPKPRLLVVIIQLNSPREQWLHWLSCQKVLALAKCNHEAR